MVTRYCVFFHANKDLFIYETEVEFIPRLTRNIGSSHMLLLIAHLSYANSLPMGRHVRINYDILEIY